MVVLIKGNCQDTRHKTSGFGFHQFTGVTVVGLDVREDISRRTFATTEKSSDLVPESR
jgi:hypothetical protein